MTKWWKCDLQVATPAWRFTMPEGASWNLSSSLGRQQFAERYMDELLRKGIEVIALADHNCCDWIDIMVEQGAKKGVTVFPGCEITTGSGSDGVHLVVIGDRSKTSRDFDVLLGGVLGFLDPQYPRFHPRETGRVPGSSSRSVMDILDEISDDYLIIAPHVLCENGLASGNTLQGDIRWRALEHPKLRAVDAGDPDSDDENPQGFNAKFRNRSLDRFPRLKDLAFVATSDAYSLEKLGSRFSWIRMESPSLEGLRQAFLDHSARIVCSWDSRLKEFPEANPNRIRHSWIKRVAMGGVLGNSVQPLEVEFHPSLNVIIGGRGSGKSTVVAAIRQLYSSTQTLPESVRAEAEAFVSNVFLDSKLEATHVIANSQEIQDASWDSAAGQITIPSLGSDVSTSFNVRVINQKELFDRVSRDRADPLASSRSFLAFLDEGLGLLRTQPFRAGSWWRRFEDSSQEWTQAASAFQRLQLDVAQLPQVSGKIRELEAQVAALDSDEARARRENNDAKAAEKARIAEKELDVENYIRQARDLFDPALNSNSDGEPESGPGSLIRELDSIRNDLKLAIVGPIVQASERLAAWREQVIASSWAKEVADADEDARLYMDELRVKGIDPNAYSALKDQLTLERKSEKALQSKVHEIDTTREAQTMAWRGVLALLDEKRATRNSLLSTVSRRSGRLRFRLKEQRDIGGWTRAIRELLNLRTDAFVEDVPALARWIWEAPPHERDSRWQEWRAALVSGRFDALVGKDQGITRAEWQKRLEKVDAAIRLRLACEVADDSIEISFLRDGGDCDREEDWQDITQGSPGQRTAAMLGFVLHHGDEPLVLDQPEDDLDTEWISALVVQELRASRWKRQLIVITHNANIPVIGDADRVIVLENKKGTLSVRRSDQNGQSIAHCGAIEVAVVREDIQNIMEGGIRAFLHREQRYGC